MKTVMVMIMMMVILLVILSNSGTYSDGCEGNGATLLVAEVGIMVMASFVRLQKRNLS